MNAPYRLMVITPQQAEGASVLVPADGFMGPFLFGQGPIDLLCGSCSHVLCNGLHPGSIENLVFVCPNCTSYNAVLSIPALENFVAHLQSTPAAVDRLTDLSAVLQQAQEEKRTHTDVIAYIEEQLPDLSSVKELLVPKGAGDFYGLVACVLGFLAWYQARKPSKQAPQVIINHYYSSGSERHKGEA